MVQRIDIFLSRVAFTVIFFYFLCITRSAEYSNPVFNYNFPDPFVLLVGTTYYAYGTSNNAQFNIPFLKSEDASFSDWKFMGEALPTLPSWAEPNAGLTWAPTILPIDDASLNQTTYIMYYTARYTSSGKQCISYATSNSADGPFIDPNTDAPWLCQLSIGGSIDPSPFVDLDGSIFLVWKNDGNCCNYKVNIWSQKLTSNGTAFELGSSPVALITNDLPWEGNLVEGPSMIVRKNDTSSQNIYYLFYSANNYESYAYAVGYAVCSSPLGDCMKVNYSPIISYYGAVWGPGGEQPFYDPHGDLWFCYHAWTAPNATYPDGARTLRIDRLNFKNDVPFIADHVPTTYRVYYNP